MMILRMTLSNLVKAALLGVLTFAGMGCGPSIYRAVTVEKIGVPHPLTSPAPAGRVSLVLAPQTSLESVAGGYRIGPGDVLEVKVWNQPELSGEIRVQQNGTITLPIIGSIKVDGLTESELTDLLKEKLKQYIRKPEVVLQVKEFAARKVYIVGEVKNPGMIPLLGETTLLQAVALAGGVLPTAFLEGTYIIRKNKVYPVNLYRILIEGHAEENVYLRDGDIIFIPGVSFRRVFVLGEVAHPGEVILSRKNMTVAEAISEAGGIALGGLRDQVKIIRNWPDNPEMYSVNMDALLSGEAVDASATILKPGDIVYVPRSKLKSINEVLQLIQPLLDMFISRPLQTVVNSLYIWERVK